MTDLTANEEIRDALVRHQIGLLRVSGSIRNRLLELLARTEPDLKEKIARRLQTIRERGQDFGPATTERLNQMEKEIAILLAPTYKEAAKLVKQEMLDLGLHEVQYASLTIQNALPVIVATNIPTKEQLRSVILSRPMQGLLLKEWTDQWTAGDRNRIMDQITVGIVQGETNQQIQRRIFGTTVFQGRDGAREITRRGADVLTRTVTNAVANNARQNLFKQNKQLIASEVYVATLDSRTTAVCRGFDGKKFPVNKGPIPPLHIRCRSTRVPAIDAGFIGSRPAVRASRRDLDGLSGAARRKKVRELTGQVPAAQTYGEFLRNQTKGFQEDVLGVAKAKLFRDGKLPLDRFVDARGKELTVDQLRRTEMAAFTRAGL